MVGGCLPPSKRPLGAAPVRSAARSGSVAGAPIGPREGRAGERMSQKRRLVARLLRPVGLEGSGFGRGLYAASFDREYAAYGLLGFASNREKEVLEKMTRSAVFRVVFVSSRSFLCAGCEPRRPVRSAPFADRSPMMPVLSGLHSRWSQPCLSPESPIRVCLSNPFPSQRGLVRRPADRNVRDRSPGLSIARGFRS